MVDGTRRRDTLEASARHGNEIAIRELELVEYPDCIDYLIGWARELLGRSGSDMNGLSPLSYASIREWSRSSGRVLSRLEEHGLFALDAALRYRVPVEPKAAKEGAPPMIRSD